MLICRGAKSQIANEDGYTPKSIAMKQIGAGPFRFGPDSDEVLNNIGPTSDAERHFIQWLKNECPANCRAYPYHLCSCSLIVSAFRFGIHEHEERNSSQETCGEKEDELPSSLSSEWPDDDESFSSTSATSSTPTPVHHDELLPTGLLRAISTSYALLSHGTLPAITASLFPM